MLLRHTTERFWNAAELTVNPAKTCQWIGVMPTAALGLHNYSAA